MATMQGITGKLSGKMGSAVFRVREGQQVVTQYNPLVKNPNTEGQQSQRAKFKLMSQLAAIMAPAMGTLGTINRPARGKGTTRNGFVQKNFALAEATRSGETVTAKVPMDQLQLTNSFRFLPSLTISSGDTGTIDIDMTQIPTDVTTIRAVVVGYKGGAGQDKQANVHSIIDIPVNEGVIGHTVEGLTAGNYTVLAFGLIPSESAKSSIDLDNVHTPADENFISAVQLNAMVADGMMAETMTVGANYTLAE